MGVGVSGGGCKWRWVGVGVSDGEGEWGWV